MTLQQLTKVALIFPIFSFAVYLKLELIFHSYKNLENRFHFISKSLKLTSPKSRSKLLQSRNQKQDNCMRKFSSDWQQIAYFLEQQKLSSSSPFGTFKASNRHSPFHHSLFVIFLFSNVSKVLSVSLFIWLLIFLPPSQLIDSWNMWTVEKDLLWRLNELERKKKYQNIEKFNLSVWHCDSLSRRWRCEKNFFF